MSMSLRERAVCSRPAASSPHCADDQPLDVEEQVLVGAVVLHLAHRVEIDGVERRGKRARRPPAHDALLGEHHQMRVVNRHQRREELRLGVLEVLVEDAGDVVGRELHRTSSL